MDDIIDQELVKPQEAKSKIYSEQAIAGGAFIGGPLAGAYLLGHNYKVFGEYQRFVLTWVISIIYTIVLIFSLFTFSFLEDLPNMVFTGALTITFYFIAQYSQGERIKEYLSDGGILHSWWRAIGMSLLFALVFLIGLFAWTFIENPSSFNDMFTETSIKNYGTLNHELSYENGNVTEDEVDEIANALLYSSYFGEDQKSYAYLIKENNKYNIYIALLDSAYQDSEVINYYKEVINDAESFSNLDIQFQFVEDDIYDVKLTLD